MCILLTVTQEFLFFLCCLISVILFLPHYRSPSFFCLPFSPTHFIPILLSSFLAPFLHHLLLHSLSLASLNHSPTLLLNVSSSVSLFIYLLPLLTICHCPLHSTYALSLSHTPFFCFYFCSLSVCRSPCFSILANCLLPFIFFTLKYKNTL